VVPLQLPVQAGQHRTCLAQKTVEAYNLIKVRRRSVSLVSLARALCAAPPHERAFLTAFVSDESLVGSLRVTVCVSQSVRMVGNAKRHASEASIATSNRERLRYKVRS
jgi:hypothetical protein